MITKAQIKTIRPGQWIQVFFDDVGVRDVIALEFGRTCIKDNSRYLEILEPRHIRDAVDFDQIVAISNSNSIIQPPRY